jgi:hypothetical protein
MLVTLQTHNMAPAIYEGNISQSKLLMYKPMAVLQENSITKKKIII